MLAGVVSFSGAAFADGMPGGRGVVYAPPYNWGGLYAGGHVGFGSSNIDAAFTLPALVGVPIPDNEQNKTVGGFQVGLQHQFAGGLVIGVEGGMTTFFGERDNEPFGPPVGPVLTEQGKLSNILWIGPRVGWALGNWMPYVTGGYANGKVETGIVITATGQLARDSSERHDGWYLGGGVEWAITPNVIFGVEYRHYDFKDVLHTPNIPGTNVLDPALRHNVDADADVVTARLSFKLGRAPDVRPLK
jgi:opacity protein-like surface antigen